MNYIYSFPVGNEVTLSSHLDPSANYPN
jgi:hypothetical protein